MGLRCSSQGSRSRMIRRGGGTGLTGISSPMAPAKSWPTRFSNAIRTSASMPDGSNPRLDSPATTSTLPTGSTHSTITASRPNSACSRSASSVAGGFFPDGMQYWWICRPMFWFQNTARGKSTGFGSANRSNSSMTRCPAPENFSINSAISDTNSPREFLVLHPVRDDGILPQPAHLVFFIILEITFEPFDMAVAFECQDVGGDAVEEPAVVADDHGAAGEILQRLFESAQCIDVEIVGRLVEQQHVGAGFEHLRQMHAVALAARQRADLLLLVGALEIERGAIAARIDLALAKQDQLVAAGDFLPHALLAVEGVARLVDIAEVHAVADRDGAVVRCLLLGDHPEQRGLAGAVRADHADNAARRQLECQIVDQKPVAKPLGQALEIDDVLTEPLGHGNRDLRGLGLLLVGQLQKFFVTLVARLGFGLTCLGRGRDPFLLAHQRALMRGLLAALLLETFLLLHQPGRIIALVGNAPAAVEFENPTRDVVEEIAVVGDDQDRAGILPQVAFQPRYRFGVEMVGRLVQEQQVGLVEQQPAQRDPAALAAGEFFDLTVIGRAAQRVHRLVDLAVEIQQARGLDLVLQFGHLLGGLVGIVDRQLVVAIEDRLLLGDAQHDVLAHRPGGVELRLLFEVANPRALGDPRLAVIFLVDAGHDPQQGRFAGAVDAEHADLGVGIKRQMDVIEHLAVAGIGLGQTLHEIDELARHRDP